LLSKHVILDELVTLAALFEAPIQRNIRLSEIKAPINGALNLGLDDLVI